MSKQQFVDAASAGAFHGKFGKTKWGPLDPVVAKLLQGKPREVDGQNSIETVKYIERLTRYLLAPLYIKGWPKEWDWNYLMTNLMLYGKLMTTDTEAGVLTLPCTTYGCNVFRQPTECISANPVLGEVRRTINEDCTVWRILFNWQGMYDILEKYAYKLAGIDCSFDINIINTRTPLFCQAETEAEAKTIMKALLNMYAGDPYVVATSKALSNIIPHNVTNTYIGDKLQIAKRNIINEFLTDIGINNANTDKRERMITDEANSNNEQIYYSMKDVLNNLYYSVDRANKMFGYSMVLYWQGREVKPDEPVELSGVGTNDMGRPGDAGGDDETDTGNRGSETA